jgi:hypothetical protein
MEGMPEKHPSGLRFYKSFFGEHEEILFMLAFLCSQMDG